MSGGHVTSNMSVYFGALTGASIGYGLNRLVAVAVHSTTGSRIILDADGCIDKYGGAAIGVLVGAKLDHENASSIKRIDH